MSDSTPNKSSLPEHILNWLKRGRQGGKTSMTQRMFRRRLRRKHHYKNYIARESHNPIKPGTRRAAQYRNGFEACIRFAPYEKNACAAWQKGYKSAMTTEQGWQKDYLEVMTAERVK